MAQNEIEQVEVNITEARKVVSRGKMAEKLASIPEFRELILEGYFKDEVVRLAALMSDPNIPETYRECVNRDVHGPSALRRYLQTLVQMGHVAADEIEKNEDYLDELRDESAGVQTFDLTGDGDDEDGEWE